MTDNTAISWVFLSVAMASEHGPSNFESISQIADGINHAVPTHKELQAALDWLTKNELVEKSRKKYRLTNSGTELSEKAKSRVNNIILDILDELTKEIENIKTQQTP